MATAQPSPSSRTAQSMFFTQSVCFDVETSTIFVVIICTHFFSRAVRYELRVLVDFKRAHRGRPKVYTGPAAKVSWCDFARNYNGLSAIGSFEQGITMVSLPTKVLWFDLARNYNGLSAIAGVHVRLSKELQWFRCRQRCYGAVWHGLKGCQDQI